MPLLVSMVTITWVLAAASLLLWCMRRQSAPAGVSTQVISGTRGRRQQPPAQQHKWATQPHQKPYWRESAKPPSTTPPPPSHLGGQKLQHQNGWNWESVGRRERRPKAAKANFCFVVIAVIVFFFIILDLSIFVPQLNVSCILCCIYLPCKCKRRR